MDATDAKGVKRVLLVDDHELVRAGMSELIEAEPDLTVCGEAEDAPSAMQLIRQTHPHLLVVDLMLQEGTGLELIKQVKAVDPSIRMLVCSMHDDSLFAERALRAGAMGYVNKQEPAGRVVEGIRSVLRGRIFVSEAVSDRLLQRVARCDETPAQSAVETLSDRELEVFHLIAEGLTTREIAEKLHLSIKTIDTYREHLKSKLGLDSATALLRYAIAWTLNPDAPESLLEPGGPEDD